MISKLKLLLDQNQADILNQYLGIEPETDDRAFTDVETITIEYEYNIIDTSFHHRYGTKHQRDVEGYGLFLVIQESTINLFNLFDLNDNQRQQLHNQIK